MAEPPMLSAVVTCYLDAEAIPLMHRRLSAVFEALGVRSEILFVNDGSPDDADRVLAGLTAADERVLAIEHSRNFGSQSAFLSGMQLARGDAVILLDGDLQDPPELIAEFYARWREGYEVVYGRRVRREGSRLVALSARVFYRVFRRVSDVPMPLDAGDFALMDRRVVDELLALPETDQFVRGLRAWVGFRQTGVDYVRPERAFGRSTHGFFKNLWWARKGIYSFSTLPIELLGYAAVGLTALSSLALGCLIVDWVCVSGRARWDELTIGAIAFFGSVNLLAITVVGEYVIKTLEETKRRPRFIRKALRQGGRHLTTAEAIERFVRDRLRDGAAQRAPEETASRGRS